MKMTRKVYVSRDPGSKQYNVWKKRPLLDPATGTFDGWGKMDCTAIGPDVIRGLFGTVPKEGKVLVLSAEFDD